MDLNWLSRTVAERGRFFQLSGQKERDEYPLKDKKLGKPHGSCPDLAGIVVEKTAVKDDDDGDSGVDNPGYCGIDESANERRRTSISDVTDCSASQTRNNGNDYENPKQHEQLLRIGNSCPDLARSTKFKMEFYEQEPRLIINPAFDDSSKSKEKDHYDMDDDEEEEAKDNVVELRPPFPDRPLPATPKPSGSQGDHKDKDGLQSEKVGITDEWLAAYRTNPEASRASAAAAPSVPKVQSTSKFQLTTNFASSVSESDYSGYGGSRRTTYGYDKPASLITPAVRKKKKKKPCIGNNEMKATVAAISALVVFVLIAVAVFLGVYLTRPKAVEVTPVTDEVQMSVTLTNQTFVQDMSNTSSNTFKAFERDFCKKVVFIVFSKTGSSGIVGYDENDCMVDKLTPGSVAVRFTYAVTVKLAANASHVDFYRALFANASLLVDPAWQWSADYYVANITDRIKLVRTTTTVATTTTTTAKTTTTTATTTTTTATTSTTTASTTTLTAATTMTATVPPEESSTPDPSSSLTTTTTTTTTADTPAASSSPETYSSTGSTAAETTAELNSGTTSVNSPTTATDEHQSTTSTEGTPPASTTTDPSITATELTSTASPAELMTSTAPTEQTTTAATEDTTTMSTHYTSAAATVESTTEDTTTLATHYTSAVTPAESSTVPVTESTTATTHTSPEQPITTTLLQTEEPIISFQSRTLGS